MSEREFQPRNRSYIDYDSAMQRIKDELDEKPQGVRQLVRESSVTTAGRALMSQTESQLLSEIINPRDRSTGQPIHEATAAYQATAGGVLLGWELCRVDCRKHRVTPYGMLENVIKQHVYPGADEAEMVALTAESLVNTSGMGLALLSEQYGMVDGWVDAIEPDLRLQSLTKIGLGLMLHEADRAVYQADLKKMERESRRPIDWGDFAQEIDAWRQADGNNS